MNQIKTHSASFRDPDARVYNVENEIFRTISFSYKKNYDLLMNSGLYEELLEKSLIIRHTEVENFDKKAYKTIKPEKIFISYPYEWCFSQYKDCALAYLEINQIALKYSMTLKDATSYNMQFLNGKPLLIDTSSFEEYKENDLWKPYGQFSRHFLAPLLLMHFTDLRLSSLMKNYIDGIPLDLCTKLLPLYSTFNPAVFLNIFLHSSSQKKYEDKAPKRDIRVSKFQLEALIDSFICLIKTLKPKTQETQWEKYYSFTNYSDESFCEKKNIVKSMIDEILPKTLMDLGANTGVFSRLASDQGIKTIAYDIDPLAVEKNYIQAKQNNENCILPLISDITNPSPSIGWNLCERDSFFQRVEQTDVTLALALIHHIAITNNVPLENCANFFSKLSPYLIIEFVEKEDSQVQKLLRSREDIFDNYNKEFFEKSFEIYYETIKKVPINNSKRILYLFKRR